MTSKTDTEKLEDAIALQHALANGGSLDRDADLRRMSDMVSGLVCSGFFKDDLKKIESTIVFSNNDGDFFSAIDYLDRLIGMRAGSSDLPDTVRGALVSIVKNKKILEMIGHHVDAVDRFAEEVGVAELVRIGAMKKMLFGCPNDWAYWAFEEVGLEAREVVERVSGSDLIAEVKKEATSSIYLQ